MKYAFPLIVGLLAIGCAFSPVEEEIESSEYESLEYKPGSGNPGDIDIGPLPTIPVGPGPEIGPGPSPNLTCRGECVSERNSCYFYERERRVPGFGCETDPYDPGVLVSADQACTELLAYSADECISDEDDPRQPETPDDDWF